MPIPPGGQMYQGQPGPQQPYGYASQPIPSPTNPAAAYAPVRMPDGTTSYAPVVAQMVNGQMQYVATGNPTATPPGMTMVQPQVSGYPGQPVSPTSYGEMYRQAVDKDHNSSKSMKDWNKKHDKEMAKSNKKMREWEAQERARQEAEEKALKSAREKDKEAEKRTRKLSGYVERDRKISGGINELGERFGTLGVGSSSSAFGRPRRQSVSVDETGASGTRSRRQSVSYGQQPYFQGAQTPGMYGRSQPPSPLYPTSTFDTGSSSVNKRSPYEGHPGSLPSGGGQYMPSSRYGAQAQSPYIQPSVPYPTTEVARRSVVPPSFYREPGRQVPYNPFPRFDIVWDLSLLGRDTHPLPAALLPCDVNHEDWNRCMEDLVSAWNGVVPYELFRDKPRNMIVSPGSAVAAMVDIWNVCFFLDRNVELVLYRGLERRTGPTAGRRDERLRSKDVPPQYLAAARRRRRHEESSSSDSDSSSSLDEVDDKEYDSDIPVFANTGINREAHPPTTPGGRSRRNSTAVRSELIALDPHEKWAVKSRESAMLFKTARKDARRERKARRKERRIARGDRVLYSLFIGHRRRT
ncbi:hypothetical protein FRC03_002405 [Tulasnella sp. 419]|nr:hypothetical protein FRC03_002405 [Tulasnella sp. 419]